ncbi:MAG: glycosyltransferase [Bacteroidetes bacterium]|nr:glycosyltransferase [Bacteroidota bacterium]
MKVLITIDTLTQGGTEQSILELVRHFSENTKVVVCYFYPNHTLKEAFEQSGIQLLFLDIKPKYHFIDAIHALRKVLRSENPDIVVSSLYRANIISRIACRLEKKPLVGTFVEDSYGSNRKATFHGLGRLKFWFTWMIDRLTAGIPTIYISNSKALALSNSRSLGVDDRKIHVIYRGRVIKNIPISNLPKTTPFRFVCISRLYEKKGLTDLIAAAALLNQYENEFCIDIIGEGPFRNKLEEQIKNCGLEGKVNLPGTVATASQTLIHYHAFVFPSWFEGFSGALVEAMLSGIPIICSDIPMNLEAVTPDTTSKVFPVKNADQLAEKMLWVINHYEEAQQMGARARAEAITRFDIHNIALQYENTLREVVVS